MAFRRSANRQRGVTLIEQIMVLAIVAILAGLAFPPLRQMLARNRLQAAQLDFIAALRHAREAAVNGRTHTLFCPSLDGSRCSEDARWEQGWLLGNDADHDNQPDGPPLQLGSSYRGKLVIQSSAHRHAVRFQPDGSAGGSNLTVVFCEPADASHVLSVVVSNSGRVRGANASASQAAACAQAR